jgi:hypothetical protein
MQIFWKLRATPWFALIAGIVQLSTAEWTTGFLLLFSQINIDTVEKVKEIGCLK